MNAKAVLGAAAGMAGGLLGSWMMVRFNHLVGGVEASQSEAPKEHFRLAASPNDTDGTISDEPASIQSAAIVPRTANAASAGMRRRRQPAAAYATRLPTVIMRKLSLSHDACPRALRLEAHVFVFNTKHDAPSKASTPRDEASRPPLASNCVEPGVLPRFGNPKKKGRAPGRGLGFALSRCDANSRP